MANVIAPNTPAEDISGASSLVTAVARWQYGKSVERTKPKIARWKTITAEIARELYLAREFLNNQQGQRKDPNAPDYIQYTWNQYCEDIGMNRNTANGWLRLFVPRELSEDGQDRLLDKTEIKPLELPAPTTREQERRIAAYMSTGERPAGWTRDDEKIAKERLANEKAKEFASLWLENKIGKNIKRDYYAEVVSLTQNDKGKKRFKLKTDDQAQAQAAMFQAIHKYLELFPDMDSLMSAAMNLTDKIHMGANYFAELLIVEKPEV